MPGPSSPPSSARSLKEEMSHFRFSLKKKEQVIKENESESSSSPRSPSINSPAVYSPLSPAMTSPLSPTNPFLSLIQERPRQTSPQTTNWKTSAPKTLVQSRIQMFSPLETGRPQASISPIAPPPVYPRQQQPTSTVTAEKPPPTQTSPPGVEVKFRSRDRQRPFSPKLKQRAITKLLHDLPVSDSSAFHAPHPRPGGLPSPLSTINPLVKKSDSPFQHTSSPSSGTGDSIRQSYISSRCSSEESLTEFSSLLKEDEKSHSRSSVCVYFDGKNIPDTPV